MTADIHVGSTFIDDRSVVVQVLGVKSQPYAKRWCLVTTLDNIPLKEKIQTEGWHLFFIATQIKAIAFGGIGSPYVQGAMMRMLKKVARENFNCMEVTQIKPKHFWGVPYLSIVAHPRHVQRGRTLESAVQRQINQVQARWVK